MPSRGNFVAGIFCLATLWISAPLAIGQTPASETVLAVVNGKNITQGDLDYLLLSRRVPSDQRDQVKHRFLQILIERRVMRDFLDSRKVKPSQTELDEQLAFAMKVIRDGGEDPDKLLAKLGISSEALKAELALPLMWKSYLRLLVTNQKLRQYFENHRAQFDGSEVRVRQIFLKLPRDAEEANTRAAEKTLRDLKAEIAAKRISFADAAAKHSEAPSKTSGGDTGWISYRGKLPAAVSDAAFALKEDEISEPVRSPFGLHLITVTERKPGELSLEDVRAVVFNELSQELWQETAKAQTAKAKIEIRSPK